jgi:GTP cyclohydrolase IA
MKKRTVDPVEVVLMAGELARHLNDHFNGKSIEIYGIPRGGIPVAYALLNFLQGATITNIPERADIFIDDIIDSGATKEKWAQRYPGIPFVALYDKTNNPDLGWLVFPWEGDAQGSIKDAVIRILQYVGEDPKREGLIETPFRVARAWEDWTCGYGKDPKDVLKAFADGGEVYDEMVLVKDIPFYSHCEHHLAPFFGVAHIAYIPNGRIVGLSKLSRLLDIFAKRLQVQERLTAQVADALMDHLHPKGAAVSIRARHLCMESRGIQKQNSETVTNALRGVFLTNAAARSEFLESSR